MKKARLFLLLLLCALLLAGCDSKSPDTEENRKIFAEDAISACPVRPWASLYAGIEEPWLAVRAETAADGSSAWRIMGLSEELAGQAFSHELLDRVNTLVICRVSESGANYRSDGGTVSRGTTETAELVYYRVDRDAGELVRYAGQDRVSNKLPEKSSKTPHLTVSNGQIVSAVKERAASRVCPLHPTDTFPVSPEGELKLFLSLKDRNVKLVLPDTVKRIAKFSFSGGEKITVWVPASVEDIAPGTFGKMAGKSITLVTEPGSFAERYAEENGIAFVHTEDYRE